jgi:phage regulator Rha-like protein
MKNKTITTPPTLLKYNEVQNKIYTIRGIQVMLDSDLAKFYGVETKVLNQAVKRNRERFPFEFMFQLNEEDSELLRSQFVTLKTSSRGTHRKYLPYVFTEQGVAMLSGVLKSDTAIKVSIQIINAFVNMRRFISTNAQIFKRLDAVEIKQVETDQKLDTVLDAIESKEIQPKQRVFFDGQVFDAHNFVSDLIRSAEKSIILIDNYIDDTILTLLTKRRKDVVVSILTRSISKQLALDVKKYNEQYPLISIKEFNKSHDRFVIIDDENVYHFGASLKDLGKKWFAFSKFDKEVLNLKNKLKELT